MSQHSAALAKPVAGTYLIDATKSQVHYSGKHMFGLGTVHATFAIREGALEVRDPITASSGTLTVDAGSFTSDNARRDTHVQSAGLLDAATYPDIDFTSQRVSKAEPGLVVSGHLTAHGKSVQVDVLVDGLTQEDTGIRVHGRVEHLDRTALGVTGSKGMVGRYLDLEVNVFARPA